MTPLNLSFLFSSLWHVKFSRISEFSRGKELRVDQFYLLANVFPFFPLPKPKSQDKGSAHVLPALSFFTSRLQNEH
jgi:hypothetical protein